MKMRAVIVEDEPLGRESLEYKLKMYCAQVELIESYETASAAMNGIRQHKPDLVFLDIGLDTISGLDIYKALSHLGFEAIFTTTSRDHLDVRSAFKEGAVDFLSKPFTNEELVAAVELAAQRSRNKVKVLHLITSNREYFIPHQDIIYFKADNNYTEVYTAGDSEKGKENRFILVSETLGRLVKRLPASDFFRIHRAYCINRNYIEGINKQDGYRVILKNKVELDIAMKKKNAFNEWMAKYF